MQRLAQIAATMVAIIILAFAPTGATAQTMERGTDRPGSDYTSFDLRSADPHLCRDACQNDGRCRAWTYVRPGVQGPNARCWLKNPVPRAIANNCCVSGVKREPLPRGAEVNTDRPGSDYTSFDLSAPDPRQCFNACQNDGRCRAWTYVRPGVQGPNARCWLKNPVPGAVSNRCCVSGVKPGGSSGFERNTDRPGMDYNSFDLPRAEPRLCRDSCRNDTRCRAWTYVRPGVQGPNARCWLKNPVPRALRNNCCVSGVVR